MRQQVNILTPALPPHQRRTYSVSRPLATHWRRASCAEVRCEHHEKGWNTRVLPDSDDERFMLRVARGEVDGVRRRLAALPVRDENGFLVYSWPAGQACFGAATHRVPADRPALWVAAHGDYRRILSSHVHSGPDAWLNDFGANQEKLARIEGGGPS